MRRVLLILLNEILAVVALTARVSTAQGTVSAALQGTIARVDHSPISLAHIDVTNVASGQRWRAESRADGRYFIESLPVGGPYTIDVRVLGLRPGRLSGIRLVLGQRYTADFVLEVAVNTLADVRIDARLDPRLNRGRTGPVITIPDSLIHNLPILDRDVIALAIMSPQVVPNPFGAGGPGVVIAGQNPIYNVYQVDGGINGDLASGGPQAAGARLISIEAVKEFQVLAAPFDVRFGGFSGGLVNTVTRSGENAQHGSLFAYRQQKALVGRNIFGDKPSDFSDWEYGGSLSGPIIRDKLHYFVSGDLRSLTVPDNGPLITDTAGGADLRNIGISYASASRFMRALQAYGMHPGSLGRLSGSDPAQDVFAKLTFELARNDHLELSHHLASDQPVSGVAHGQGSYDLTSTVDREEVATNASRLIWTTLLRGHLSNELGISRVASRQQCQLAENREPIVVVTTDGGGQLTAGGGCESHGGSTSWSIDDNLSFGLGPHVITVGAHGESIRFADTNLSNRSGLWFFDSLDSLEHGIASDYERALPGPLRPNIRLSYPAGQIGMYLQDRWTVTRRLTLMLGTRVDMSVFTKPAATDPLLRALTGYDTGKLPGDHPLWSPRLGVNYDVHGDGETFLRVGVGVFTARLPGRYVRNGYTDSGGDVLTISCRGDATPRFNPLEQPATCGGGPEAVPQESVFDPKLRLPQTLKFSFGADRWLPAGVVATFDVLFSRGLHTLYFSDLNLGAPTAVAYGEGNRPLYGTPDADAAFVVVRPLAAIPALAGRGPITHITNRDAGHDASASVRLEKAFEQGLSFSASYTYSRTTDLQSTFNYRAHVNIENAPLDGTFDHRNVGTSEFEVPHKLLLTGSSNLPLGVRVSLLYVGASQRPYSFVVQGDANGDGIGGPGGLWDDLVYVPRRAARGGDVSLVENDGSGHLVDAAPTAYESLQRFIDAHPCLSSQRGSLMRRNSCRDSFRGQLNARLTKRLPQSVGKSLSLVGDVFNLPNLLVHRWGRYSSFPEPGNFPIVRLLQLAGWDATNGRGQYRLMIPRQQPSLEPWRVQLGARWAY